MKRVLITGANSYIGESVRDYLLQWPDEYRVAEKDTIGWAPSPADFSAYDTVFNVAGIAHIRETPENKHMYYDINRDLVIRIAKAAKAGGVKQFILLSTMSVYGLTVGYITKKTIANPVNAYGRSKVEADQEIEKLADESFRFACLRPPMVYGNGCKGNYQRLRKFALKSPIFPDYPNQRSMIFIGNLCSFVKETIDHNMYGLFFPQNAEYVTTGKMAQAIANENGHRLIATKAFNWVIKSTPLNLVKKVFGDLTYEPVDLVGEYSFQESIQLSESKSFR